MGRRNFGEEKLGHHRYRLNKKNFEAKGKRNTEVRLSSQVVKESVEYYVEVLG